jgi:Leucine-rich repeat (LRR) protein
LKKLRERKYNGEFLLKKREKSFKKDGLFYKSFLTINDLYFSQFNASIEDGYIDSIVLQGFEGIVTIFSRNEKNKEQIIKTVQRMIDEMLDPNWRNIINDPNLQGVFGKSIKIQLDENRIKALKGLIDFFTIDKRSALIRPKFMEYCGEKGKYSFEYFETSMDHLQKIIDNIPRKRKTKTIDIIDIIPKPDFRKADNRQLPKIIKICEKPSKYINASQFNRKKSNKEIKNSRIRAAKEKAIQELKELNINDNNIRIILYRALNENKKYRVEKYSIMGRYLASWLYQAHQETFKKVIEMSKSK